MPHTVYWKFSYWRDSRHTRAGSQKLDPWTPRSLTHTNICVNTTKRHKALHRARSCVWREWCKLTWTEKVLWQKWNKINKTIKESHFAVAKVSISRHKTWWRLIQHIFCWKLVNAADNRLNTSLFFCILTCSATLLSILVKARNVNVNLSVHNQRTFCSRKIYI